MHIYMQVRNQDLLRGGVQVERAGGTLSGGLGAQPPDADKH